MNVAPSVDCTEQRILTSEYSARHNSKYKRCVTGTHSSENLIKFSLYDCSCRVPWLQSVQPKGGSQTSLTPVAEDITTSSDLFGHCKHVLQKQTFRQITHTSKIKVKGVLKCPRYYFLPDTNYSNM